MTSTADDIHPWFENKDKVRFLEWLLATPEFRAEQGWPDSQNKLAVEIGVTAKTLSSWRKSGEFRAVWEKAAKDAIGEPDRIQKMMDGIIAGAMSGDNSLSSRVAAAKLVLEYTDGIKPPAIDLASKKAAELSDKELEALLAQAAQAELNARQKAD